MIEITGFQSLLQAAHEQAQPQRLLFVFVKTALPEDASEAETKRYHEGRGGGLVPVMVVDKAPAEIADFETLAEEAREMGEDWHMMLVGALAGRGGRKPAQSDVDEALNSIVQAIHAGGDLSHLLAFDRAGDPLRFD